MPGLAGILGIEHLQRLRVDQQHRDGEGLMGRNDKQGDAKQQSSGKSQSLLQIEKISPKISALLLAPYCVGLKERLGH